MNEYEVTADDIVTFYATEMAQIPSIKCPECETATPLHKLVSEGQCENCHLHLRLALKTEK